MASACCSVVDPFGGDLAQDAHAQAGPGERLTQHDLVGQAELLAELADLVLEQVAQRFDELQRHVVGQATDVVMALDDRRRCRRCRRSR